MKKEHIKWIAIGAAIYFAKKEYDKSRISGAVDAAINSNPNLF